MWFQLFAKTILKHFHPDFSITTAVPHHYLSMNPNHQRGVYPTQLDCRFECNFLLSWGGWKSQDMPTILHSTEAKSGIFVCVGSKQPHLLPQGGLVNLMKKSRAYALLFLQRIWHKG
mmetsp:Transcript_40431/g.60638  ORF Transcript_40431/g.60638 Transcript_40431/m.60638 type:complete len:117 (-) Transcript_40431:2124-2474(-)